MFHPAQVHTVVDVLHGVNFVALHVAIGHVAMRIAAMLDVANLDAEVFQRIAGRRKVLMKFWWDAFGLLGGRLQKDPVCTGHGRFARHRLGA